MKIGLELSFGVNSLNGLYYLSLLENYIKFEKYAFRKNSTTKAWNEKRHIKLIASIANDDSFGLMSNNNDLYSSAITGSGSPHRSVSIIQEKDLYFFSSADVEKIINQEGFVTGYLYDEDYTEVQSTSFSTNYDYRNYPSHIIDSIKDTPYRINAFGNKEYDIECNPGRMHLIGHCWLMAAYKMWFGDPFFELVPKEIILSFADAYEIKELNDGKIFVQLFENIEDSASEENMEKQRKWRNWLDFEKLIEMYQ